MWVEGRGPALVLVHGSLSDHTPFQPLIEELRDVVTSIALDRRGLRCQSGRPYPKGIKIPDKQLDALITDGILARHDCNHRR